MEEHYGVQNLGYCEMVDVGSSTGAAFKTASLSIRNGGSEMEFGGDVHRRWPRLETLTLLEVRTRLNPNFEEANHKGPLWNEVSRIMCEEHGYQRSGKKCREKFENLYKYYKRTKEGKAGRQDGKHYRFFRQLQAIYGENEANNPNPNANPSRLCHNPYPSNTSSSYDTFSEETKNPYAAMQPFMEDTDCVERMIGSKGIKGFIDARMRMIMDKQEAWMETMMKTIEQKEQERISRVEQWRKDQVGRLEDEQRFCVKQRAWMEARESVLMQTLHKVTKCKTLGNASFPESNETCWGENEIMQLIHFRTNMMEDNGITEEVVWDEIASKMAYLGYNRNASICKTKWDSLKEFLVRSKEQSEDTRSSYFQYQAGTFDEASNWSAARSNASCYRLFMGDQENH